MPGTTQPQHGIQGLWAQLRTLTQRVTNLETWQRTGAMLVPSGAMTAQSRALGTAYQPSTTRPTFVLVTFALNPGATAEYEAVVRMDASDPPTTTIASAAVTAGSAAVNGLIPVPFIVPPGFYYEFVVALGSPVVASTFEMTL